MHLAVFIHIVPVSLCLGPSRRHCAVRLEIISGSIQFLPAGYHGPAGAEIISGSVQIKPAGLHHAASIHVIPGTVYVAPAGSHQTCGLKIIPTVLQLLPAHCHLSRGLIQIIASLRHGHPAKNRIPAFIHVVPALAVIDPGLLLHHIVFVIITVPGNGPPGIIGNYACIILKKEVNVNVSIYSVYGAGIGSLPHRRIFKGIHGIIPCHPDIVIQHRQVNLVGQPVFIGIHHGIISRVFDLFAESIDHLTDLRRRQGSQSVIILRIKSHRIGNRIILDQFQNKIRLLLRHLHRRGIRINICSDLQTGFPGLLGIYREIRIYRAAKPGSQHGKGYIVSGHLLPVNVHLPVRYIDSSGNGPVNGCSVCHLINTVCPSGPLGRSRRKGLAKQAET